MVEVKEIEDKSHFYAIRNLWENMLRRSPENSIFLTWEKTAPSVIHLGDKSSLRILFAAEDNKIVGIAPFKKTRKSLVGHLSYNIVEPVTNGNTDYTGIVITEQDEKCLSLFLSYLFALKDWDVFFLPDLPQWSPTLRLLGSVCRDLPRFRVIEGEICPYITIPESKEKLIASLNPKFRRELRRRLSKLRREHGRVKLEHYCELGSLESGINLLFELHQKRWTRKGEPGTFASQNKRNIVMDTAKLFAQRNWLRLYFLTVDGKPVAAEYSLEYGGRMYGHLCGFDPDYSKYSVGNLLLWKVLEICVEKGISEYDFMQGDEPYKSDWTAKHRQNMTVSFVNNKLSSKLIYLLLKAKNIVQWRIKKLLPNRHLATNTSSVLQKIFGPRTLNEEKLVLTPTLGTVRVSKSDSGTKGEHKKKLKEINDRDNPCFSCLIEQECCRKLRFLRLTKSEYMQHFAQQQEKIIIQDCDETYLVSSKEGQTCPHFKNDICTIYADRPIECRLFPYTLGSIHKENNCLVITYHERTLCPNKGNLLMPDKEARKLILSFAHEAFTDKYTVKVKRESFLTKWMTILRKNS
jgi:CelD/BcsL family acetyltransferase involved in cellulose biosynthesis/Fe-S-cluster containining protein